MKLPNLWIAQASCAISLSILLKGCALFDSGSDVVVDDYNVGWIDLHETRTLYNKGESLLPAYVFAAGHDSKFIFAKQYPVLISSPTVLDMAVVYYYIIERTKNSFQDKPVYGPMNKQIFDQKCVELGIKDPKFDLTYPTNL